MLNNILDSIICTEFDQKLGRSRDTREERGRFMSHPTKGMKLKFSLSLLDYGQEEGYRNLEILIFGGGSNYITVAARLTWTVIETKYVTEDGLEPGHDYTQGTTGWILYGHHDSCWRDAVHRLLWEYRDRLLTIGSVLSRGWYEIIDMEDEERRFFAKMEHGSLEGLEFKYA